MGALVSFEDSIKERLKGIVADLIPEERWDSIVRTTVSNFERDDLPRLIKAELSEQYRKIISIEFAKPEWQAVWSNFGQEASPKVKQMLIEMAPAVLASMIGGAMQSVAQQFQNALQARTHY